MESRIFFSNKYFFPGFYRFPVIALFLWPGFSNAMTGSQDSTDTVIPATTPALMTTGMQSQDSTDTVAALIPVTENHDHSSPAFHVDSVKLGERLFKGLLPRKTTQPSCVSCHNLTAVDTLNRNPSAHDIAFKYLGKTVDDLKASVMEPDGIMMEEVHRGYQYDDDEFHAIKVYLDDLATRGTISAKPNISRLLLFIFLSIVVIWCLTNLIFFRKTKYKFILVFIMVAAAGYQLKMLYEEGVRLGRSQDYQPVQPVKFSHKVHAEQNQIDCKYCHYTAETSKLAGIPPADLCLNCHSLVLEGTTTGMFEIAKIHEAHENQVPIQWIRIHNLPDHVFFSHAQHVNAGKLDCMECHGDVEKMDEVRQVETLSMGWCLDCHRTTEVQFTDNKFYAQYEELHEKIKKGQIDRVTVEMIGGTDCMKCHY